MYLHANFVHDVSQFENIDECWAPCCSEVPDETETDNPFIRKYIRNVLIPNLLVYGCLAIPNHANCHRSLAASVAFIQILAFPFFVSFVVEKNF